MVFGEDIDLSGFDALGEVVKYPFSTPEEAYELGIEDAFLDGVSLIEWPEIASDMLPNDTIHIYITEYNGGRKLVIK